MESELQARTSDWWVQKGHIAEDQETPLKAGEWCLLWRAKDRPDVAPNEPPLNVGQIIGFTRGFPLFHTEGGILYTAYDVDFKRYILNPPKELKDVEPNERFTLTIRITADLHAATERHGIVAELLRQHAMMVEADCNIPEKGATQHTTSTAIAVFEWDAGRENLVYRDNPPAPDFSMQYGMKEQRDDDPLGR